MTDADYEYLLSVAIEKLIEALKVCKLTECESSRIKLEEYKTDQSSVLRFLKDFRYEKKTIDHIPCSVLYDEYKQYCMDTGFKTLKKVNFDKEICEEYKMVKKNTTYNKGPNQNQCWRYVL